MYLLFLMGTNVIREKYGFGLLYLLNWGIATFTDDCLQD